MTEEGRGKLVKRLAVLFTFGAIMLALLFIYRHRVVLFIARPLVEFVSDPRNAELLQNAEERRPTPEQERYLDLARLVFALPERLRRDLHFFGGGDESYRHSAGFDEMTEAQWRPLVEALDAACGKEPKTDPKRYEGRRYVLHGLMLKGGPPCEEPHVLYALRCMCGFARVAAMRRLKVHAGILTLKLLRAANDVMRSDGLGFYRAGAILWKDALAALREYAWGEKNDKHLQKMHVLLEDVERHTPLLDFVVEEYERQVGRAIDTFQERFSFRVSLLNRYYGDTKAFVRRAVKEWKSTAFDPWPKAYKAIAQTHVWFRNEPLASTYFARILFPDMVAESRFFHDRAAMTRVTLLALRLRLTWLLKGRFPEELDFMPDRLAVGRPDDPISDNIFGYSARADGRGFTIYTFGVNSTDDRLKEGSDDEVLLEYEAPKE